MLKKQLITIGAVLCILLSGACISTAVHDAYEVNHPPPPSTTTFAELSVMKVLKIEVVDETKEKYLEAAELASAIANSLKNYRAISGHSHVTTTVDDLAPADGKLIIHLISEEAGLVTPQDSTIAHMHWMIAYRTQFVSGDGRILYDSPGKFEYNGIAKRNGETQTKPEHAWSKSSQKFFEEVISREIIYNTFMH